MARYIDADLIKNIELIPYKRKSENISAVIVNMAIIGAKQVVDEIPTADVVPVKHAHWKWDENGMDWNIGAWVCSNCGLTFPDMEVALKRNAHIRKYANSYYCGCCGAKMDEVIE